MGYLVRSNKLNVGLVLDDAETIRQAKAIFRRFLKEMKIDRREWGLHLSDLTITRYDNATYDTFIKIIEE
jgi:hypothetical protein